MPRYRMDPVLFLARYGRAIEFNGRGSGGGQGPGLVKDNGVNLRQTFKDLRAFQVDMAASQDSDRRPEGEWCSERESARASHNQH